MAGRAPTARRPRAPTPTPRRGSSTPAATAGASGVAGGAARARVRRRRLRPPAGDLLGRRADPRLAGAGAGRRPRPAAARRADQPPRHRVAGVARAPPHGLDAAIVLVAHDRWFLEAVGTSVLELEAGRGALLRRPLARLAHRAGGARAGPGPRDRAPAGRDRADGALRRALPLQGDQGRQAQSRLKRIERIKRDVAGADPRDAPRRCASRSPPPERSGRVVLELEDGRIEVAGDGPCSRKPSMWLERGEHVVLVGPNGSGKTTLLETLAGPPRAGGGQAPARATTSSSATSPSTPRSAAGAGTVLEAAQRADRAHARRRPAACSARFLFSGEDAEKPLAEHLRRRAAPALAGDPGRTPAPTC